MIKDFQVWDSFLKEFNGRAIIQRSVHASDELHFCSDSSKWGYGATFLNRYIFGPFPPSWQKLDIQVLELYPIFAMVSLLGSELADKKVLFHCDNIAVVFALNKQTSRNPQVMKLLRPMVLSLLKHNVIFKAIHVPGVKNVICDSLSRNQVPYQLLAEQGMDPRPLPVPHRLRPTNLKTSLTD